MITASLQKYHVKNFTFDITFSQIFYQTVCSMIFYVSLAHRCNRTDTCKHGEPTNLTRQPALGSVWQVTADETAGTPMSPPISSSPLCPSGARSVVCGLWLGTSAEATRCEASDLLPSRGNIQGYLLERAADILTEGSRDVVRLVVAQDGTLTVGIKEGLGTTTMHALKEDSGKPFL